LPNIAEHVTGIGATSIAPWAGLQPEELTAQAAASSKRCSRRLPGANAVLAPATVLRPNPTVGRLELVDQQRQ
jgi:hypothetical protein